MVVILGTEVKLGNMRFTKWIWILKVAVEVFGGGFHHKLFLGWLKTFNNRFCV